MLLQAGRLKRALQKTFGVKPKMHFGPTGSLDVLVDGHIVYSLQAERRRADADEIAARIRALGS